MKLHMCVVLAILAGVQAKPHHDSFGPEMECLEELHLTLKDVMPYVHKYTDPADNDNGGPYLLCVWQKRKIITEENKVCGRSLSRYLLGIYGKLELSEEQKHQIFEESEKCEDLEAEKLTALAVKAKNCMLEAVKNLPFLELPKH